MPYATKVRINDHDDKTSNVKISSVSWAEPRRPLPFYRAQSSAPGYWTKQFIEGVIQGGAPNSDVPFGNAFALNGPGSILYTVAYDRLYRRIGEKASLAMTLMDRKKSCEMISARCKQLINLVRKAKAGKLAWPSRQARKRAPTTAAASWLEYTFGWVPLVEDIASAVDVMQSSPPWDRVRGRAQNTFYIGFDQTNGDSGTPGLTANGSVYSGVSLSCAVRVSNPNLYLANQLGFVNPALVAWDAVPFSFVVDWFIPVGKFLGSFTNDWGLELLNCCTNRIGRASAEVTWWGGSAAHEQGDASAFALSRTIEPFVRPGLLDRAHWADSSLWMAATQVSLLVQQLQGLADGKRRSK